MGVAAQQQIPRPEGRQVVQVPHVAVGEVGQPVLQQEDAVVGQDGKLQHHLVHLAVAVAPDAEQVVGQGVEQGDDLLGGIVPGQVVAGAVVEQVSQQNQPGGPLPLEGPEEFLTVVSGAVEVRRDHPFHGFFPFRKPPGR